VVQFTGLVGVSVVFDIIYMARNQQNWFSRMITIFILILKVSCGWSMLVEYFAKNKPS
jgi:hypothetical protein